MRIFIADDEIPIVQWIKFCIERSGENYQIAGNASNGEDAFQGIINGNVDIAILDIMMPRTNGLELLVKLKEHVPNISVFMLTNFSDFKYIQQALRLGADEYYLKSEITEEILMSTLKSIVENKVRLSKSDTAAVPLDYALVSRLGRETISRIITTKADFEKVMRFQRVYENFQNNLFVIAVKTRGGDNPFYNATVLMPDIAYLTAMYHAACSNNISLLVCEMKNVKSRLTIYSNISSIMKWIKANMPFYYAGISNVYYNIIDLFDAVNEAEQAMNHCFYGEEGSTAYIWDVHEKPVDFTILTSFEAEILSLLKEGNYRLIDVFKDAFLYFKNIKPNNITVIYDFFTGIFHTISSHFFQQHSKPQFDYLKERKLIMDSIRGCVLLSQLEPLIMNDLLLSIAKNLDTGKYSTLINNAIVYIQNHFDKQITLQSVASHFHINPDYFGKIFKKEVKTSFNSFLTDIRMKHAEELLRTTNMKKYEIAEKIGYTNFSYFSRVYRKYKK